MSSDEVVAPPTHRSALPTTASAASPRQQIRDSQTEIRAAMGSNASTTRGSKSGSDYTQALLDGARASGSGAVRASGSGVPPVVPAGGNELLSMQNAELNNGRLAMLAAAGWPLATGAGIIMPESRLHYAVASRVAYCRIAW